MADEFDFETGLFAGIGVVTDEWFAVSEQNPNTQLFLKVVDDTGGEHELRYGLGPDWASFDGGETVEHPKGPEKRYNNRTPIAELFRFAFESGAEEVLRKRSVGLAGRGPFTAKLWDGLKFEWIVKEEPYSFKNRQTGEQVEGVKTSSLPTAFLGENTTIPATETNVPGVVTETPAPAADPSNPMSVLTAEDAAKAKVLAKTVPYPEWVDKVMELPNAVASPTLMAALGDEALYNQLKEG